MKIDRWKKLLTFLCVLCLTAGTVGPFPVSAADSTQTAEGTAVQAETEDTGEAAAAEAAPETTPEAATEPTETPASSETADTSSAVSGSETDSTPVSSDASAGSTSSSATLAASESPSAEVTASSTASQATSDAQAKAAAALFAASAGLDLESQRTDGTWYLKNAQLSYQDGDDWVDIGSDTVVSAYTKLRFTAYFNSISAQEILAHGGTLYMDIPSLLQNPTVTSGIIKDADGNQMGTVSASGQRLTLQMDTAYLQEKLTEEGTNYSIENGQLTFTATPNPDLIRESSDQTMTMGPLSITIHFDPDSDARNGELEMSKSSPTYSVEDGVSYLTYTLKVTAGDAPMPEVTVTDHFTANAKFVDLYAGITDKEATLSSDPTASVYETIEGENASAAPQGTVKLSVSRTNTDPGTLLWTIGDMTAGETRTLTYKVKLKDDYVGVASSDSGVITNKATPKSRAYEHNSATSNFTPKTAATVTKKAGDITQNADDTITIPYTVTVTADKKNTWAVKNLKISDYLGDQNTNISVSMLRDAITADSTFPNLGFTDFTMSDGTNTVNVSSGDSSSATPYYALKGSKEYPGFNFYVGDIGQGESRTITYKLTMKPIFAASAVQIGNRASVWSNDQSPFGNKVLSGAGTYTTFEKQNWDRKVVGSATESEITQDAPASAYTYSGSSWTSASSTSAKTIPAGSYEYRVVVNENGSWDVSSSAFTDELANNGTYLNYAGYLKLDYYKTGVSSSVSSGSDTSVADTLAGMTPDKTYYLDIDGMKTFTLSPRTLDSTLGAGAYLLTYYAKPMSGNFSRVTTGNSFSLSGTVIGPGGRSTFTLPAMNVRTSVAVTGSNDYTAHKDGWYYDSADTSDGFTNGRLYWVISVSGTKIPAGVQLLDRPQNAPNHTTSHSIAGIYLGPTETDGTSFTDHYAYYSQIENNSDFEKLPTSDYSWDSNASGAGTLTFKNDVTIPSGKTLYVILMTVPNATWGQRALQTFNNKLQERSSQSMNWQDVNTASLYAFGQGTNFKEVGAFGAYDSTTKTWSNVMQKMNGYNLSTKVVTPYNTGSGSTALSSGTYIDYHLIVNYGGDEEGSFRVEDAVPDGLEPVYVRYYYIPRGLRSAANAPTMPEITDLGDGWTDIGLKGTAIDSDRYTASAYAYYNASEHKIVFDASNLKKSATVTNDQQDLQVQIVMRVTDRDALIGASTTFTNTMTVYRPNGELVSTSSTDTTVKIPSITKNSGDVSGGDVPFSITVNPRAEDLLSDSDTLTLVDELSGDMTIDASTVKVIDSDGNALDSGSYRISLSKTTNSSGKALTTMTLVVPDSRKLVVSYSASINAAPGTNVTYSNTAYWFGYKDESSSTVTKTVKYDVDASFGFSYNPVINLIKADQNNASKELSGAQFSIYLAKYDETAGKWSAEGDALETKKTGQSGTHTGMLSFGSGTNKLLFNTVYAIVEENAPAGYVKDPNPILVAMARKDSSGSYPNESAEWNKTPDSNLVTYTASQVAAWSGQGVNVNYKGSTFTYTAYNQKASLKVDKAFLDADGSALATPPDGTFTFGLYNSDDKQLQTLTIRYSSGTATYRLSSGDTSKAVSEPVFSDLNVEDAYSVYELDVDGSPVKGGRVLYTKEGDAYVVTYPASGNSVTADDSLTAMKFGVTNQKFTVPETGVTTGNNNRYIWFSVLAAGLLAGWLFLMRRRRLKGRR